MKKNVLALSIATMIGGLGFAGIASADVVRMTTSTATDLSLAEGGVGHALIVPYFNAQNGNMTVLHVVNTDTTNGKAVKVRFRGAANSDDILDFQVFMSPGDVWTAAVSAGADGTAQLVTADNTCTLPKLTANVPQPFIKGRLNPALAAEALAEQTREGYVEIFNMADIPFNSAKESLYQAIKHVNGTAPCTPAALDATLKNISSETDVLAAGFKAPTGTLAGDWYIQNVAQTTTFSGAATAVVATAAGVSAPSNFVHFPQMDAAATTVAGNTADPLFLVGGVAAANYDLPDLSTPFVTAPGAGAAIAQASLLTQALAVKSVSNQFANDAGIFAKTDWVFSMPTRRYSVAMNYTKLNAATTTAAKLASREFTPLDFPWFVAGNTTVDGQLICVNADKQTFWDREENSKASGAVFSPDTVKVTRFCGETSVMSFGVAKADTSVLGASVAREAVFPGYVNGWGLVNTNNGGNGLPILGASFIKLSNANATPGMSGTYGITWPHRFTK